MVLRKISYLFFVLGFMLVSVGGYIAYTQYKEEEKFFIDTEKSYYALFNDKGDPIEKITLSKINKVEKNIKSIKRHEDEKEKLSIGIKEIKDYYLLKNEIDSNFPNKILNLSVNYDTINQFDEKYKKLSKKYQKYLESDLTEMKNQRDYIDSVELEISSLFVNNEKTDLKENITKEQVEGSRQKLTLVKQSDFIENKNNELNFAISIIDKREEERKRKEEEERRKREEEIKNAWVVLNVPYISQNQNNVLNGCEAASLLMGLQYKGYLQSMTLQQYATDIPKSTSPYEGFIHDIFSLEPRDVVHWIAPGALAAFGRNSSGNPNVLDVSGYSLADLDNELANNNPVIIYATASFNAPKEWVGDAPKNMHVQLLTGYNKITGEQIITDPWTYNNGRTKWYLSKSKLETIYKAVGSRAVVIR